MSGSLNGKVWAALLPRLQENPNLKRRTNPNIDKEKRRNRMFGVKR
jgi:hypothetical protein